MLWIIPLHFTKFSPLKAYFKHALSIHSAHCSLPTLTQLLSPPVFFAKQTNNNLSAPLYPFPNAQLSVSDLSSRATLYAPEFSEIKFSRLKQSNNRITISVREAGGFNLWGG